MSMFDQRKRQTKIDVLDLLINTLQEHEKKLDEAIERLEVQASKQSVQEERLKTMLKYYSDLATEGKA